MTQTTPPGLPIVFTELLRNGSKRLKHGHGASSRTTFKGN